MGKNGNGVACFRFILGVGEGGALGKSKENARRTLSIPKAKLKSARFSTP